MRDDLRTQLDTIARRERRKFIAVPVIIVLGSVFVAMGLHALGFQADSPVGALFDQAGMTQTR